MNNFKTAFLAGKITKASLNVFHRRGTYLPGRIARRLCPQIMKYIGKPKHIICITGTDGKTTTSNMIEDCLRQEGVSFTDNNFGSNTIDGIITTFLNGVDIHNKSKYDYYILEVDERSSPHVYKYIEPDYIICADLFRDSVERNANTDFIFNIINDNIPSSAKLILNSDDIISSRLGRNKNKSRTFFSIAPQEGEKPEKNIINDAKICPDCGGKTVFTFRRYHHIGKAYCPECGLKNPDPDYTVEKIDRENGIITVNAKGKEEKYKIVNDAIFNIYNEIAAITVLRELGYSYESIKRDVSNIKVVGSRFKEEKVGNTKLIFQMTKGLNPVAFSRSCHMVPTLPGKKQIFIMIDDERYASSSSENTCWHWESDVEALNTPDIEKIYIAGPRAGDLAYRFLTAGFPEDKILYRYSSQEAAENVSAKGVDTFVIMHDIDNIDICYNKAAPIIREKLKA